MEKKSQKAYKKAMILYEEGNIDKALWICEDALSEELNNNKLLNFKGLLLYQQGKLNEAITVWKLNVEFNKDKIAENYIKDSQNDFERLNLYRDAEKDLKNFNIESAINNLKKCAISDFNAIHVNTALAMCYQKKGDYSKAIEYVNKSLKIDKNCSDAVKLKKQIEEYSRDNISKNISKKSLTLFTILFVMLLIGGSAFAIYMRMNHEHLFKNNIAATNKKAANISNEIKKDTKKKTEQITVKKEDNKEKTEPEQSIKTSDNLGFDKENIEKLITDNNVDGLCNVLKGIDKNNIPSEDMYLYRQAIDLINKNGVINYYNKGLEYYNMKNFESAEIEFDKAYSFCKENSYKEHILFYRASNLNQLNKTDEAIKAFEEYYNEYPKGVYSEGVLYELILLYNSSDKTKSKQYANELINNFPNSIYINDNVKTILNQ